MDGTSHCFFLIFSSLLLLEKWKKNSNFLSCLRSFFLLPEMERRNRKRRKLNPFFFISSPLLLGRNRKTRRRNIHWFLFLFPLLFFLGKKWETEERTHFFLFPFLLLVRKRNRKYRILPPLPFSSSFSEKREKGSLNSSLFFFPFLLRMGERREKEKPGKFPAGALSWALQIPTVGLTNTFLWYQKCRKIKRNTIIYAISFLYSSFSKKNEGIY